MTSASIDSIARMRRLKWIDLSDTGFDRQGIEQLRQRLGPHVTIGSDFE